MKKDNIKSDVSTKNYSIIGTFEGECADANITNLNGLDITREVWETVFASDDYKQAIELKWYLGYLGHPEDPNCMDFEHACIVMTEGHIDENGKVYGKFNLVDTPVGQIVKKFIDAGVTFGISVRGAGDIINNSVDPETFVFRGFDLVTFPAFPESIPVFTEIAASSDIEKQKKYKAICAAVDNGLNALNTVQSVEIIQSCFAKQSDQYKKLDQRKKDLEGVESSVESSVDLTEDRVNGLTDLYLSASEELKILKEENARLRKVLASKSSKSVRKMHTIQRIMSSQMEDISDENSSLKNQIKVVKSENLKYKRKIEASRQIISTKDSKIAELSDIVASSKEEIESLSAELDSKESIISSQSSDIKSKEKIIASTTEDLRNRESELSDLQATLDETVRKSSEVESSVSNFDEQINELNEEITAAYALIEDYQNAYAVLYANAIGVNLSEVSGSVTASTTVSELKKIIGGNTIRESRGKNPKPIDLTQSNNSLITL